MPNDDPICKIVQDRASAPPLRLQQEECSIWSEAPQPFWLKDGQPFWLEALQSLSAGVEYHPISFSLTNTTSVAVVKACRCTAAESERLGGELNFKQCLSCFSASL